MPKLRALCSLLVVHQVKNHDSVLIAPLQATIIIRVVNKFHQILVVRIHFLCNLDISVNDVNGITYLIIGSANDRDTDFLFLAALLSWNHNGNELLMNRIVIALTIHRQNVAILIKRGGKRKNTDCVLTILTNAITCDFW